MCLISACPERHLEQVVNSIEDCSSGSHADYSRQQAHVHGGYALLVQQVAEGADDTPIHMPPRPHHPSPHDIQGEASYGRCDTCKHIQQHWMLLLGR